MISDSYCPENREDWRMWLAKNHKKSNSIWLVINKKSAPNPNLLLAEAIEEALCFGWIDSIKKSLDSKKYKLYFSKRKPTSTWSTSNKTTVKILIDNGLMTEAGYKSIDIAKSNGSWSILDDVEALVIPHDMIQAFNERKGSREFYECLSPSVKKSLLQWVILAKRTETRQKRIMDIAENGSKNLMPKPFR